MGLRAIRWAWGQHDVTPSEKLTLLALADQADGFYNCDWIGLRNLAGKTGLSRWTLTRALKGLVDDHKIEFRENEQGKFCHLGIPASETPPPPGEDEWCKVLADGCMVPQVQDAHVHGAPEMEQVAPEMVQDAPPQIAPQLALLVTGSSPDLRSRSKNKKRKRSGSGSSSELEFPPEDSWLKEFLETQHTFNGAHLPRLLDPEWWEALSIETNGISRDFLDKGFAGMKRWLLDSPGKMPTPRGVRRFVANWLKNDADKERRFSNGNQSARK